MNEKLMTEHDKRIQLFMQCFENDAGFHKYILLPEEIPAKTLKQIKKKYAQDIEDETIIGLILSQVGSNGKKGILFTDYKVYCNLKKTKIRKIWYDEILDMKCGIIRSGVIVFKLEEEKKARLETTKTVCKRIKQFIQNVSKFNNELGTVRFEQTCKFNNQIIGGVVGFEFAKRQVIFEEYEKEKFHAKQGHGFAAEAVNNDIDRLKLKKAKIVGNDNVKNGPDRKIVYRDGTIEWIQTKYCKNANASINACFDEQGFRYFDSNGKPMSIEVASDQYEEAIRVMEDKIRMGQVNGVTDPGRAKEIVKKGNVSYKTAVNIAKAGNIDSLKYDAVNGAVISLSAFGISALVSFATSIWNGENYLVAVKNATYSGVKVGGTSFVTSVVASQLSKAGLNSALVPGTEAFARLLGTKASASIANAFRGSATNIYGVAAIKSAAKILRTNLITSVILVVVLSIGDIFRLIKKQISFKQFVKNTIKLVLSVSMGVVGGIGGATLGTYIMPGFGTVLFSLFFAIFSSVLIERLANFLLSRIIKEDSEDMMVIVEKEFKSIAEEYLLSKIEAEKIADKLMKELSIKKLRIMYSKTNREAYIRSVLEPIVEHQVQKRKVVSEPSSEIMMNVLNSVLESLENEEVVFE